MTNNLTDRANALTDVHSPRKLAKMLILATEELEHFKDCEPTDAMVSAAEDMHTPFGDMGAAIHAALVERYHAPRKTSRNDTQGRDQG